MADKPPESIAYSTELRFGVVMYGGVSLAIYINGVTTELFEMACATPRVRWPDTEPAEAVTREVYRRLSLLADDPVLRQAYSDVIEARLDPVADVWSALPAGRTEARRTRFVVDVIAGTSAGGINGIYLAKALANGEAFSPLARLWVEEGDIGRLLNDQRHDGEPPASLLDSDRMYGKLLQALRAMPPLPRRPGAEAGSPLVDELDLFVTTTDIVGAPVPLRLFDQVVLERRHKQRFHFRWPSRIADDTGHDFAADNSPFLAFAARCTSSFPFAFEPMTLARTQALATGVGPARLRGWKDYFDALPAEAMADDAYLSRPFGDGGYLDNKPFSYVVEALSQRFGEVPSRRKLLYVEPDPERLDGPDALKAPMPNAVENAINALVGIPLYETIREDLQVILQRNRRIERVERIVRLGEEDVERLLRERSEGRFDRVRLDDAGCVRDWRTLWLDAMVNYYGEAYLPYQRLRVYAGTDWQAEQMAGAWGVDPESDSQYALRALARRWRERHFADQAKGAGGRRPVNAFLDQYDLDYRVRRLGFLLRRIDRFTEALLAAASGHEPDDLGRLLGRKLGRYLGSTDKDLDPTALLRQPAQQALLPTLAGLKQDLRDIHRDVLGLRRERARGRLLSGALGLAAADRDELAQVLRALLGQLPAKDGLDPELMLGAGAADASGKWVPGQAISLPVPGRWARTAAEANALQDMVFDRVTELEARLPTDRQPRLWWLFEQAMEATRVTPLPAADAALPPLGTIDGLELPLERVWKLLHSPRLEPRERDGQRLATLVVNTLPLPAGAAPDSAETQQVRAQNALRMLFGEYFLGFDPFDQMRYPLYYGTDTGEPSTVDVVRVSPLDATALRQMCPTLPKLAGTALAHFGAFLDERWRRNDILWGRLDGAERLVHTALPGTDEPTKLVSTELVRLAHGRILQAELVRPAQAELTGLLARAVAEVAGRNGSHDRLGLLLDELDVGVSPARQALAGALEGLLRQEQLIWYASTRATFDPQPRADATLRNAARAVAITGRMLEAISKSRDQAAVGTATRWLARLGLVLQGVVALSVPRSLGQRWRSDAVRLLYGFEVLLLLLAWLTGGAELRWAALSALLVTVALHLLTLVAGDYVVGRNRWWRLCGVAAGVGVTGFAAFGAWVAWHLKANALCLPKLPQWLGWLCG
jgi:patatin-related protein